MNDNKPYIPQFTPTKNVGQITNVRQVMYQRNNEWLEIIDYLHNLNDIKKYICVGCGFARLYDKNYNAYKVFRRNTLEEVKTIVEEIRKINQSNV